ncbi:cytochrome P450 4c21-like [Brevipalpus obovatus]|uniref:cytochrome P450 4c21-like n=1 Tax=Brevipalpus obovatus TaxID=246614 RepID=UPI003D9EF5B2
MVKMSVNFATLPLLTQVLKLVLLFVVSKIFMLIFNYYHHIFQCRNFPRLKYFGAKQQLKVFALGKGNLRSEMQFVGKKLKRDDRADGWCAVGLPAFVVAFTYTPEANLKILNAKNNGRGWVGRLGFDNVDGIIISKPPKWNHRRGMIAPGFAQKVLQSFVPTIVENSMNMVTKLGESSDFVEIWPIAYEVSMSVLLETSMGLKNSSLSHLKKPLCENMDKWFENQVPRAYNPLMWFPWMKSVYLFVTRGVNELDLWKTYCRQIIRQRLEDRRDNKLAYQTDQSNDMDFSSFKHKAFLDHLIDAFLKDSGKCRVDEEGILEEVMNFSIGGVETVASLIMWTLHSLANYPDIQEELYQELHYMSDNDLNLTIESVEKLSFIDQVCKETLRLRPGIPWIPRCLGEDVYMGEHKIPKDTMCVVSVYYTHRDPLIYPNHNTFDPSRFTPENFAKIPAGGYIPFGDGARRCIGYKVGVITAKIVIGHIIKNYKVFTKDPMNVKFEFVGVMRPKKPIEMRFEKR